MQPIKIFFSWVPDSVKDRRFVYGLENHLADQMRLGEVTIWHAHKTSPGANEKQEILTNLNSADIILIFMSPDYMATDYYVDVEGRQAASMQSWGIATVRIILVRPIDYRNTSFNFCQVLPKSGEFISGLPYKDKILHNIALNITELVKEAHASRSAREENRIIHSPILHRSQFMPVMTPIESLIKRKQTDEIKLERHTDDIKSNRQTKELKQKKPHINAKQRKQVFAAEAAPSEYAWPPQIKPLPKTPKSNRAKKRRVQSTRKLRSTSITNWLESADRKYKFMSRGYLGIFFYGLIIIDTFGIPTAFLFWSHSWIIFALAFIISLPSVVIGAMNTGSLIPLPLALVYGTIWGIIISHYRSLSTLNIIIIIAVITSIHILLFHNYRLHNHR